MPAGLQLSLMYKIMQSLGEARERNVEWIGNTDLIDVIPEFRERPQTALVTLNRHLNHLSERGYVRTGSETHEGFRAVWLTAAGEIFLQPELAELGGPPMMPAIVKSLENRIAVLTYPEDEKDGMLYRLREAVAKGAPDVIAKVIVELGSKMMTGGM
jgi:hypothetical protein